MDADHRIDPSSSNILKTLLEAHAISGSSSPSKSAALPSRSSRSAPQCDQLPAPPLCAPPDHLRLMMSSWTGTYDWAHNGVNVNGLLKLNQDRTLYTDFSSQEGSWIAGEATNEIVIEWRTSKGWVQHGIQSTQCEGGLVKKSECCIVKDVFLQTRACGNVNKIAEPMPLGDGDVMMECR